MMPELLKLYEALQPLFREKMGERQVGDWVYDTVERKEKGMVIAIDSYDAKPVYNISFDNGGNGWRRAESLHRLPLPIDPVNPGRDLWSMLHSPKALETKGDEVDVYDNELRNFTGSTPVEALLKALVAQEGVKI